jgi:hypothetical protein
MTFFNQGFMPKIRLYKPVLMTSAREDINRLLCLCFPRYVQVTQIERNIVIDRLIRSYMKGNRKLLQQRAALCLRGTSLTVRQISANLPVETSFLILFVRAEYFFVPKEKNASRFKKFSPLRINR